MCQALPWIQGCNNETSKTIVFLQLFVPLSGEGPVVRTQVNSQCSMVLAATERNRAKEETREHSGGRWEGRKASLSLRLQRWGGASSH